MLDVDGFLMEDISGFGTDTLYLDNGTDVGVIHAMDGYLWQESDLTMFEV